ncbi:MAG TPA: DUF4476 domain-containing protein [Archangium sp.]|uniref:DUF4476 domain-containing protein n=1 Tax=Archangium sp. TaxID=1872627 RepID=UPI002E315480|nr:DUF4476 domain-containing protein [Archangium sp.]HEX5747267.1 DUF4476 domain-containing protein [Archangium sp.]
MKALFVALTLLTAVAASAQTAPTLAPPPGQPTGNAPPTSNEFRGRGDDRGGDADEFREYRRGRRGTLVVLEREDLEQRLADLEDLLGQAFESSKRGNGGKAKIRAAYEELKDLRELVADAPELRGSGRGGGYGNPGPIPPPAPAYQPIAEGKLQKIMGAMSREPFAEDKMNVLQDAVGTHYFLVGQVQQVLNQFQFSQDRLKAVRVLWSRVLDRDNGFQLYNSFQFSNDKAELKRILSN